jgi:hypothetical protein
MVALTTLKMVKETVMFGDQVIVSGQIVFVMVSFLLVVLEVREANTCDENVFT